MMTRAVYPGTFDPIHYGHLDIAQRASQLFDELVFAINDNRQKHSLFTINERLQLAQQALRHLPNVTIITYNGLTVDCALANNAQVIVRGLRNLADFQFEHQLGWANHHLASGVETCCLFCARDYAYLSSTILKEVASLGGNYSEWTTAPIQAALRAKYVAIQSSSALQDGAESASRRARQHS